MKQNARENKKIEDLLGSLLTFSVRDSKPVVHGYDMPP